LSNVNQLPFHLLWLLHPMSGRVNGSGQDLMAHHKGN